MVSRSQDLDRIDRANEEVQLAPAVTPDLMSDLIAAACVRVPALNRVGKRAQLDTLVASKAWTEAALTPVEIELPGWTLRRLVREDGTWLCSLSRQASLPLWLDDTVDASHEVLPLAILGALLEARRLVAEPERSPIVPQVRQAPGHIVACDNFS
jgi:hypothetical protein